MTCEDVTEHWGEASGSTARIPGIRDGRCAQFIGNVRLPGTILRPAPFVSPGS
jgi:hypothetical protein